MNNGLSTTPIAATSYLKEKNIKTGGVYRMKSVCVLSNTHGMILGKTMTVVEQEYWLEWFLIPGSIYEENYFNGKDHFWYDDLTQQEQNDIRVLANIPC